MLPAHGSVNLRTRQMANRPVRDYIIAVLRCEVHADRVEHCAHHSCVTSHRARCGSAGCSDVGLSGTSCRSSPHRPRTAARDGCFRRHGLIRSGSPSGTQAASAPPAPPGTERDCRTQPTLSIAGHDGANAPGGVQCTRDARITHPTPPTGRGANLGNATGRSGHTQSPPCARTAAAATPGVPGRS